jgi:class 3 adenylate cyclase/tetratricopeptide (TPR) repeat protein
LRGDWLSPRDIENSHIRHGHEEIPVRQHKRVIAILFCDLVGSSEMAFRLEAEDVTAILDDYRAQVSAIVAACGGHVARALGDGILAYFGYPNARENDAANAVRAAIAIIDGLISSQVAALRVRIGIALGEVIVTESRSELDDRPTVVGHAANLAARIQALAAPDTAVVSEEVYRACSKTFKFRDLGVFPIKGVPDERLFLAVAERTRATRHLPPMVGRQSEMSVLEDLWKAAAQGQGSAVLISGEPGIGKSRLAAEVQRLALSQDAFVVRAQSAADRSHIELHSLHELLRQVARVQRADTSAVRQRKLERSFALFGRSPPPQLVACLAGLGEEGEPAEPAAALQTHEQQIRDLLAGLAEIAKAAPILLIHEDAQWIDATSEAWLVRLIDALYGLRVLLVVTARRDYAHAWSTRPHVRLLVPRRLDRNMSESLVARVPGFDGLPDAERADIVERAEGVPFYLEELAKDAVNQHRAPRPAPPLPLSLNAVLLSRLDAVASAKRLAQMASVLGRSFDHDTAALVWGGNGPEFARMVEALMAAEVLLPKPVRSGARYAFRHALLQEAAYASLLREERAFIHARVADVLMTGVPEQIEEHPEFIAYHCDCAGRHELATRYWLKAGQGSARRGAVSIAANSFRMGLASAEHHEGQAGHDRLRFELLLGLGAAVMAESGYTSREALTAFEAARSLMHCASNRVEELQIWLGLFNVHFGRGELAKALEVATLVHERLLPEYGGYPVLMGQAYCSMGRYDDARRCLELALQTYNPAVDGDLGLFCRADVVATSFLAKVDFAQGRLQSSAELTERSLVLARSQGHPIALAIAMVGRVFLLLDYREMDEAGRAFREAYAHATRNDLSNYLLWLRFMRAALALRADPEGALSGMKDALAAMDQAETLMFRPAQLALLAGAFATLGRWKEALEAIDRGLDVANHTQAREAVPALYRLQAKLLTKADPAKAFGVLQRSLREARAQGAVLEELRSATLIARAIKDVEGKKEEARSLLAGVYDRMTKELRHPDVSVAASLLDELR